MNVDQILLTFREGKLSAKETLEQLRARQPRQARCLLSEAQRGLWMLEKSFPEAHAYNVPLCMRIRQAVDPAILEQAFESLLQQHRALASIILEESGTPYRVERESSGLDFRLDDLHGRLPEDQLSHLQELVKEPFSLTEGLFRVHLLHCGQEEWILLIVIHHLVFDGASVSPLMTSLFDAYGCLLQGKPVLVRDPSALYADFVAWEKRYLVSQRAQADRAFWIAQLQGSLAVLAFPLAGMKGIDSKERGSGTYTLALSGPFCRSVREFAADQSVSQATIFLAAYQALLHRYSGEQDIVVGMPTLGRPEERFESLVGNFTNPVAIRSNIGHDLQVAPFLQQLKLTIMDALDHATYPFSRVVRDLKVERSSEASPIFQAVFEYKGRRLMEVEELQRKYNSALSVEPVAGVRQQGEYGLVLEVVESAEGFTLHVTYDPEKLAAGAVERLALHLQVLLKKMMAAPQALITGLPLEQQPGCLHQRFSIQAKQTPNATAAVCEGESLTYGELDRRANRLAQHLRNHGVGPDVVVGLSVPRSLDILLGILGILKAGGAYLPLDPQNPPERIAYMLSFAKAKLLVTRKSLNLSGPPKLVYLDEEEQWDKAETAPVSGVQPANLAYVIYTSGSTGQPNGVMVTHQCVNRLFTATDHQFRFGPNDVWTLFHSYGFDFSVWEIWGALLYGGKISVVPHLVSRTPELFYELLIRDGVTVLNQTPSAFQQLLRVDADRRSALSLRYVIFGGEGLHVEALRPWLALHGDEQPQLINMYGITETTVHVTFRPILSGDLANAVSPIGKPLADLITYVLDDQYQPVPAGMVGELYVGGAGLARGYIGNPSLTATRFIPDLFAHRERLYRTGDLARRTSEGELEFLGRADFQVKIRGHRVELGEIENALLLHPAVREAIVLARPFEDQNRLVAYLVLAKNTATSDREIRESLKTRLPDYMLPTQFVSLDAFPLTQNGKADRKVLAAMESTVPHVLPAVAGGHVKEKLLALWRELLQVEDIRFDDGFFDVGGDSILAVTLATRIRQEFGVDFRTTTLFKYTNIESISRHIEALTEPAAVDQENQSLSPVADDPALPSYYQNSVAIIGISCQFPGAQNAEEFWKNLMAGQESIRILSREELSELGVDEAIAAHPSYVPARSVIDGKEYFDAKFFNFSPRDAELTDPQLRLLLSHAWGAVEDAGYRAGELGAAAVFMSASNSFYQAMATAYASSAEGPEQYLSWVLAQGGTIPTIISHRLGLTGRSLFVHSNCSSSLVGLDMAYRSLTSGECNYALVGAATVFPTTSSGYLHHRGMNFSSDGHLKAFDQAADGMIGGEGVAVIVVKRAVDAVTDGDHIYALLRGCAVNNDGSDKAGYYAPSVQGQARVIQKALAAAGVEADSIGYVEAHGTGTRLGDPIEFAALNDAYGPLTGRRQFCGLGSVKTNIGHTDTAAGLAGCIKVVLSLERGQIPPSLHYSSANPEINFEKSPFFVVEKTTPWNSGNQPRRAALSSFGIGGTNVHAIFEQYATRTATQKIEEPCLLPLSAKTRERLQAYARRMSDFLNDHPEVHLRDLAYTLQAGREPMDHRVVFAAQNLAELPSLLALFAAAPEGAPGIYPDTDGAAPDWFEAASAWVQGRQHEWPASVTAARAQRISLPTYPFAQERHWIPDPAQIPVVVIPVAELDEETVELPPPPAREIGEAADALRSNLAAMVRSLLKLGADDFDVDAEFMELGFDSIRLIEFANRLNEQHRLAVAPTLFFEYPSVRQLADHLAGQRGVQIAETVTLTRKVERRLQGSGQAPATPQREAYSREPIAIIGVSGCFPQAPDLHAFWENVRTGQDCVTEIPADRWNWREIYGDPATEPHKTDIKWGAFLESVGDFDPLFFGISPREAELIDPQQRLLMTYLWKVIEDAGYAPQRLAGSRTAIFVGTAGSGYEQLFMRPGVPIEGYAVTGFMPSAGPSRMSYLLDLHGPSEPIETACSSSLVAIHRAIMTLERNDCEMAIAGGVNTIVSAALHISASKAGMLSPDGHCKTFSASANGFVRGEGVGMLLLKKLSTAERDGDNIYAVIRSTAENHGGRASSMTAPSPRAQTALLQQAYMSAGIDPRTVTYIEAHGTGTSLGDPIEINALKSAFRELYQATGGEEVKAQHCGLGSVKTNIGHLELAAGVAGVIKVLLQMKHKTLAASLHCQDVNPYIDLEGSPFYLVRETMPWVALKDAHGRDLPRRAGVSSFGIGGVNAHVVLEEYRYANPSAPGDPGSPALIVLSAKNQERLREYAADLLRFVERQAFQDEDLPGIAYTLQVGRDAMEERLAFSVASLAEFKQQLTRFLHSPEPIEGMHWGSAKRDRETLSIFSADEDLQTAIETWVQKRKYRKLLDLWVKGLTFDWERIYLAAKPRRMSLPTYPFERKRYWVPEPVPLSQEVAEVVVQPLPPVPPAQKSEAYELLLYSEAWSEAPLVSGGAVGLGAVLCYGTEEVWQSALEQAGFSGKLVFVSQEHARQGSAAALSELRKIHGDWETVLYLWALEDRAAVADYASIQQLIQALAQNGGAKRILLAGEFVGAAERSHLDSWIGFDRSLKLALPQTTLSVIFAEESAPALFAKTWTTRLWKELHSGRPESALYLEGRRYVSRVRRNLLPAVGASPLRPGGRYLVTGGSGGLGLCLARYLAQRYSAKLVITGRSAPSETLQQQMAELVNLGGEVRYVQADVCDVAAMRAGIEAAEQEWGAIQGLVHAAGLAGGKSILENDEASFARVLAPKVNGTLALEEVLRGRALDFVCYFSSASAVLGDFGGCDYAIGNRFELAYADHRERERALGRMQGRTVAIAWPHWNTGSMGISEESESMQLYLKSSGQRVLRSEEGLELWERLLAGGSSSWLVMAGRPSRVDRYLGVSASPVPAAATVTSAVRMKPVTGRRVEMRGLSVEQCVLWDLREQASDQLKLGRERLDTEENLAEFGFDSIGLAQYAQRLSHYYGLEIVPSVFFSHPTLGRLSKHLAISHGEALAAFYGETSFTSAGVVKSEPVAVTITPSRSVPASSDYEPIAIVGRSGRFPGARNVDEMWRVLLEGRTTVTEIPGDRFDWREQYGEGKSVGKWCGSLSGVWEFDPLFFEISPREAEGMDPRQRLLLQECWLALENAGYGAAQLASQKVGVFVGVEAGDYGLLRGSGGLTSSNDGILAARLGYFLNLHGPAMAINTTCSSGLVALHQGCQSLRLGESDTVIAAGVNLLLTPYGYQTMSAAGMLSADGCCYAFDRRANGMVPGEAVVAVVLKRLRDAEASGDPIHGVIRGSGINYDGRTNGITAPNGESQTGLLREVYERSGVAVERVEYIVTHGTGTQLGDPIEIQALCAAYGEQRRGPGYCALTSSKTNFGHTFAASGLVSLLGLVEAMKGETIPASLHCEQESSYIRWDESPFYVNKANRPWPRGEQSRVGAVSAFGMSGTNAHVVVESYEGVEEAGIEAPYYLLVCSGRSEAALQERLRMLGESLSSGKWSGGQLAAVSQTLLSGRHHFAWRCAVVVTDAENGKYLLGVGERGESAGNVYRGKVERDKGGRASLQQYGESLLGESWEWMENSPARYRESLEALGDLYCQGYELGWEKLYGGRRLRRVELPGYPFAREHYGPGMEPVASAEPVRQSRYLRKGWVGSEPAAGGSLPSGVLLLASAGSQELAQGLAERLVGARVLGVDQPPPEDIDWSAVGGCIDLAACEPGERSLEWIGWLQRIIEGRGQSSNRPLLLGVTYGLESCGEAAPAFSAGAALRAGLYRMLESESRAVRSRHVDLEAGCSKEIALDLILKELTAPKAEFEVCWRNGRRLRSELLEVNLASAIDRVFPPGHVLWITGGTRGLGLLCARHFVEQWGVRKLLLSGREPLPPRAAWGASNDPKIQHLAAALSKLEAQGAEVRVASTPLADGEALMQELAQIKSEWGPLGGVLHCAGRGDPATPAFVRKSLASIEEVLEPKVRGLDNVLAALQGEPLRFVVLFSSVSATVPMLAVGQSDYAMANAYMDYRATTTGAPLVSVQWPSWKETGMGEVRSRAYSETGLLTLTDQEGLQLLDEVLAGGLGSVIMPVRVDADVFRPGSLMRARPQAAAPVAGRVPQPACGTDAAVCEWFAGVVSEQLKIPRDRLEVNTPLTEYGVDSVLLAQLLRPVAELVGTSIDPSLLFEYPSVAGFSSWLAANHGSSFSQTLAPAAAEPRKSPPPASAKIEERSPNGQQSLDIAVVGLSCRFPGAPDVDSYWRLLAEGRSAIARVPTERWESGDDFHAALLDNVTAFDARYFQIPAEDARVMDPQALLVLEESLALWHHAGYLPADLKGEAIGVYLGARSQHRPQAENLYKARNPIVALAQNYLASNISRHFDLRGPSLVVDTACSSALVAMSIAIQDLERGETTAALVGGVSILDSDSSLRLFSQRGILNHDPAFHLFDRRAQGAVLGEGVGMVLLKRLDQAKAAGDSIYAVVKAMAINNDGRTAGPTAPNVQAQKDVMRAALARSGKQAGEIGYIEVNGSGTEVSDLLELKAIESVYRPESRQPCELGSIKPNIGHPLTAEAIASVIKVVLMLHHRQRVPFLSAQEPMEHYDLAASPFRFTRELTEWTVHPVAAVNCFADGGTNAHIILEAPPAVQARRSPLPPPQLLKVPVNPAPRLERAAASASSWRSVWEQDGRLLLTIDHPVLRNHCVYGQHLLPGVAYIDLLYQHFSQKGHDPALLELKDLSIYHPLAVSEDAPLLLNIGLTPTSATSWRVEVLGSEWKNAATSGEQKRYASAEMHQVAPVTFSDRIEFAAIEQAAEATVSLDYFYAACRPFELVHGAFMQGRGNFYQTSDAIYLACSLGEEASPTAEHYLFHPALIDCSVVSTGALLKARSGDQSDDPRLILPLFYHGFRASEPLPRTCVVRMRFDSVREKNELTFLTVEFFHREGRKLAELKDFVGKLVREPGLINPERRVAAAPPAPVVQVQPLRTEAERSSVLAMLRQLLGEQLQIAADQVDAAAGYYEMGLTSAGLLEMVRRLESRVGTSLSPTLLFEYTTLLELADYLESKYPEQFAVKQTSSSPAPASSPVTTAVVAVKEPRRDGENLPFAAAEPIAIVGMSGRFAQAENLHQFWENLKAGRDCITEVPPERWDWRRLEGLHSVSGKPMSRWGGFISHADSFDAQFFRVSPREAEMLDPQERLFLEVCWEAIEDAGYTAENLVERRGAAGRRMVGVFVGCMHKDYALVAAESTFAGHVFPLSLNYAPIANRVSYFCNFHGPSVALDTTCSSSLTALHMAVESLRQGESEVALAGGVNLSLHPAKYMTYGIADMHSTDGRCRGFGEGGDGYVSGEGVGAVLLKPLSRALAAGDHIYALVRGSGLNHGGRVSGITVPSPVAQSELIASCLAKAGMDGGSIGYVEAHGTGTPLGDPIEMEGLTRAFRQYTERRHYCAIGTVKSNIGHAEAAAGVAGLIKVALQLHHRTLVPTLHAEQPNPHIDWEKSPFVVQRVLSPWEQPEGGHPRRSSLSSFGATGSNAHVLLEEWVAEQEPETTPELPVPVPVLVLLSARTPERLRAYAARLKEFLNGREVDLSRLAYTLQLGREAMEARAAFLVRDQVTLQSLLGWAAESSQPPGTLPPGCWLGSGKAEQSTLSLLGSDEDSAELVEKWMAKARLEKLAELWTRGLSIPWRRLYPQPLKKLSLPTYPFQRQKFWVPAQGLGPAPGGSSTSNHAQKSPPGATHEIFQKVFQGAVSVEQARDLLRAHGFDASNGNHHKPQALLAVE